MKAIAILILSPIIVIARGLVLVKLWEWFIVYHFDLKPLTIPVALGIALIISYLTYGSINNNEDEEWWYGIYRGIIIPLMALFIGWIYTLFM